MFKKLLANLPFNPSLIDQVGFYAQRLRRETMIRRLGFVMVALSLLIQIMAALYPAQTSLAASPNDVLNGITTKSSLLRAWDANTGDIRAIYGKFGITRANIAAIPGEQPNATISTGSKNYWSVGRLPLNSFGIDGNKWGERRVNASGKIVYQRPLGAWDTRGASSYAAFRGKNQFGVDFWILQICGNPTFDGPYLPTPPKPRLEVHKNLLTPSQVKPGATVKYRIEYQNTIEESLATGFKLTDNLNSRLEFVSLDGLSSRSGNLLTIARSGELGFRETPYVSTLTVKVKNDTPNSTIICNAAVVTSDQTGNKSSNAPCITVVNQPKPTPAPTPAPPPAPVPAPSPAPAAPASGYCVASSSFVSGSNKDFTIRTQAYVQNTARIVAYRYDIGADGSYEYRDQTSATPYDKTFRDLKPGFHTIKVAVELQGNDNKNTDSSLCQAQINIAETPRVNLSKTVKNMTRNVSDASGSKVYTGDILEFKLITKNVTASDYPNYKGNDYFGDVLQYADIVDSGELNRQGMRLDSNMYLAWTTDKLKANSEETKTIKVKVKEIPATNSPSTLSPDFNCKITNVYGNQVTMSVDCPIVKTISQTTTTLPNTGPGTTIAIGAAVAVVAGYLFSRSRIMVKELEAVKSEFTLGGGL